MRRPFRRYSLGLAERLGYGCPRIMYQYLTVEEIMEYMAYDKSIDSDFIKEYNKEIELKKSEALDTEERCKLIRQMLGG